MRAPSPDDPAVLVVGAGPVGLVLACELTRHGVPIRVVDKLAQPTAESRAILVHARSLEMMERIGVVDELIASGIKTTRTMAHSDGRAILDVPLDTVDSPFPFSVTTAQTETERVLTERLAGLGVTVDRGVELVSFEQDADGVHATLRHGDGREERVTTAWIAGTDGSRSAVRQQAGTRLVGTFKGERFLLGDVEADHGLDARAMHLFISADHPPLIAFPMAGRRMRLIAELDGTNGGDGGAAPTLERLQAVVDARADGIRLRTTHWTTVFEIRHAQVPRYRWGRAFLAGDAAHIHSPAGGQGMNTGMQDAFNLAWKLALVHAGRAGDALLDSYDAERHPIAAHVISTSTRATRLATIEHSIARTLRNRALRFAASLGPVQRALADEAEETKIAYRGSPIVAGRSPGRGAPHPGDAAPDVPGTTLRATLLDGAPGETPHTVVSVAGRDQAGAAVPPPPLPRHDGVRHVLVTDRPSDDPAHDAVVVDPDRRVGIRYSFGAGGGMVVVRPDGYIGLIAELDDADALAGYLATLR